MSMFRNIGISPELDSYNFLTDARGQFSNVNKTQNINCWYQYRKRSNQLLEYWGNTFFSFFVCIFYFTYIGSTMMKYLFKHILENLLYLFAARKLLLDSPLDNNFIDYLQIRRQMLPQQKTCLLISKCYCSLKMAVRYLRFFNEWFIFN